MNDQWKGCPCLVTGGAGFGGSHLCEQLLHRGARVYVLDRILLPDSYLILSNNDHRVKYICGDIRDMNLVKMVLERYEIDTLFHIAAQPIVPISNEIPFETFSVNATGTYTLLEAVRTVKCTKRFVFASSGAYYGSRTTNQPIKEEDPPVVAENNIYGPSKVAGDVAVRAYAKTYKLKAAVCRFINTYGPGDTNFSRIVPRAIKNLIQKDPFDFGDRDDGTTQLDYMYIRDMSNAYITVAEHLDSISGESFNFGGGNLISTYELSKLISRLYDGQEREPKFLRSRRETPLIKRLDLGKAKQLLNWQPSVTLEEGLQETIKWYCSFWDKI